jgi:hypothetical protein
MDRLVDYLLNNLKTTMQNTARDDSDNIPVIALRHDMRNDSEETNLVLLFLCLALSGDENAASSPLSRQPRLVADSEENCPAHSPCSSGNRNWRKGPMRPSLGPSPKPQIIFCKYMRTSRRFGQKRSSSV